jgi:hypothetical protein
VSKSCPESQKDLAPLDNGLLPGSGIIGWRVQLREIGRSAPLDRRLEGEGGRHEHAGPTVGRRHSDRSFLTRRPNAASVMTNMPAGRSGELAIRMVLSPNHPTLIHATIHGMGDNSWLHQSRGNSPTSVDQRPGKSTIKLHSSTALAHQCRTWGARMQAAPTL